MKIRTSVNRSIALAVMATFIAPTFAFLTPLPAYAYSDSERYFDREEIEQLTAPIALYPDPLLAQILSAAAYPEEIAAARRYAEGRSDYGDIDRQDWDPSVRAIARYPEVLDFLARDLEWTEALGIAAINQPDDVADAIQRWRLQAYDLGNLRTNSQQIVYVDDGYVRLVPAQQDYFYVPRYDPQVIYVTRYSPSLPFLFFGPRYAYGSWFDKDWDWKRKRYYYCNRDHWRNGRPVFYPQFDRVYVDHNRRWEPDRRRFHPPERPKMPPRFVHTKVPPPPPDFKPGVRRDNHPPQARPDDRRDDRDGDKRTPVIRRGSDNDKQNVTPATKAPPPTPAPTRRVEQPQPRKVEPPRHDEQPRRSEPPKQAPARVEQPKPQPQPQPQKQAPSRKDDDDQQRGPRR